MNTSKEAKIFIPQILIYMMKEIILTILLISKRFIIGLLLIYGKLSRRFKIWNLFYSKEQEKSKTATDSGHDANAGWVNMCRYLGTFLSSEPKLEKGIRKYEELFLTYSQRILSKICLTNELLLRTMVDSDCGYVLGRTVMMDRLMKEALEKDKSSKQRPPFQQIIILGAGYDTRAYRFENERRSKDGPNFDVKVIEIDQEGVQKKKKRDLSKKFKERSLEEQFGVEYIQCNFDHPNALKEALDQRIASKKFDPSLSTFILWEGVTYYLSHNAIKTTLQTLSTIRKEANSTQRWQLVFDFVDEKLFTPEATLSQKLALESLGASNSPFLSGLPKKQEKLSTYLKEFGMQAFKVWDFLTMMAELFDVHQAGASLPFAVAQCEWTA